MLSPISAALVLLDIHNWQSTQECLLLLLGGHGWQYSHTNHSSVMHGLGKGELGMRMLHCMGMAALSCHCHAEARLVRGCTWLTMLVMQAAKRRVPASGNGPFRAEAAATVAGASSSEQQRILASTSSHPLAQATLHLAFTCGMLRASMRLLMVSLLFLLRLLLFRLLLLQLLWSLVPLLLLIHSGPTSRADCLPLSPSEQADDVLHADEAVVIDQGAERGFVAAHGGGASNELTLSLLQGELGLNRIIHALTFNWEHTAGMWDADGCIYCSYTAAKERFQAKAILCQSNSAYLVGLGGWLRTLGVETAVYLVTPEDRYAMGRFTGGEFSHKLYVSSLPSATRLPRCRLHAGLHGSTAECASGLSSRRCMPLASSPDFRSLFATRLSHRCLHAGLHGSTAECASGLSSRRCMP